MIINHNCCIKLVPLVSSYMFRCNNHHQGAHYSSLLNLRLSIPNSAPHIHQQGPKYRVSQEVWTKLRESVPYVELYRYNTKHLYPKLNGYGDNGHRKVCASGVSTYCTPSVRMPGNQTPLANVAMQ